MKAWLLLSVSLVGFGATACTSKGAPPPPPTDPLDCGVAVRDLVRHLEADYIAFAQMHDPARIADYEVRRARVVAAADTTAAHRCTELANRLTDFFDDGHLSVFERPTYTTAELDSIRRDVNRQRISADRLQALERLARDRQAEHPDGIEGVWSDGRSRFVVTADAGEIVAHVATTSVEGVAAGERKMTVRPHGDRWAGEYLSYGHDPRYLGVGVFRGGQILRGGGVTWVREGRPQAGSRHTFDPADPLAPSIVRIDAEHTLLTIPSFSIDADAFEALLDEHDDALAEVRILIVDIRGNRGGNTIYFPLIERFATRTIPASQGLVLSSPDNVAYFRRRMGWISRTYRPLVERMEANPGSIVAGPEYPERSFGPRRSQPDAVAILTDGGSMSAAESFVLHARAASDRVTTFGQPTEGVIDYTSVHAVPLDSGRRQMSLRYPTGTLHGDIPAHGYNRTGIVPDVALPDTLADPVEAVLRHYRSTGGS